MDTAIKIAQLIFFIISIGTMGFLGVTSFLKEREWKRERKEAEERYRDFDKFSRELMSNMTDRSRSRFEHSKTVN